MLRDHAPYDVRVRRRRRLQSMNFRRERGERARRLTTRARR